MIGLAVIAEPCGQGRSEVSFIRRRCHVECSRDMRYAHPVGTRFRVYAKETSKKGGTPFLYSHYNWPYEIVGRK